MSLGRDIVAQMSENVNGLSEVDRDGKAVWERVAQAVGYAADYLDNEAKLLSEDAPQDALVRRLAAQRIRDDYGRDATRKRDAREA